MFQRSSVARVQLLALAASAWALALLVPSGAAPPRAPLNGLPALVVWAWERPEDLRTLDPSVGVAFLSQTISLAEDRVIVEPRRQPLQVEATTALMAVTRLETSGAASRLPPADIRAIASYVAQTHALPRVVALQLDFDAVTSERVFYRALIQTLREKLGPETSLSITALASWCVGDDWLKELPIDEAVPMLFRMGPIDERFRAVAVTPTAVAAECAGAVGISLDEPLRVARTNRRLYVFSPRAWTSEGLAEARRLARQ